MMFELMEKMEAMQQDAHVARKSFAGSKLLDGLSSQVIRFLGGLDHG